MSYDGLRCAADAETPHLGGNITVGDPFTWCPGVWDYVISRFGIESALDLGSGCGNASLYLAKKGLQVLAVDGFRDNVDRALYPTIQHDLTRGPVYTKVDLVHCQELVEHISEQYLDNVLDSLLAGRIIIMTHAVPGQSGHHHVNLQPAQYWIGHLARRGCSLLAEDTSRIREIARRERSPYMAETGMIFSNNSRP